MSDPDPNEVIRLFVSGKGEFRIPLAEAREKYGPLVRLLMVDRNGAEYVAYMPNHEHRQKSEEQYRLQYDRNRDWLDGARSEIDAVNTELDDTRGELDTARTELDATKGKLNAAATSIDAFHAAKERRAQIGRERAQAKRQQENAPRDVAIRETAAKIKRALRSYEKTDLKDLLPTLGWTDDYRAFGSKDINRLLGNRYELTAKRIAQILSNS
jgi:hypothetical protein